MTVAQKEQEALETLLQTLLESLDLDVGLEVEPKESGLYFNISGPDAHLFLKNREDTIRGITFLLQTYQQKHFPESEVNLKVDAENALLEREKELQAMALEVAERLAVQGDEYLLDPLNPYERRLVHLALVGLEHIETESLGDGHFKRMKISRIK